MVRVSIDLSPVQQLPITEARIQEMITWKPRRMQLSSEWPNPLHEPKKPDKNWSLVLPFCETFRNAFKMCDVDSIGLRAAEEGPRCYTFLNDARENPETLDRVKAWLDTVGRYVAIRDCLALSFALDYDRQAGNPKDTQTEIGKLRSRAKPYDKAVTSDVRAATKELSGACLTALKNLSCYDVADAVAAMPPARMDKKFDLPQKLAAEVARGWKRPDLSAAVRTIRPRPPIKNSALTEKLGAIEGTVDADAAAFRGKSVLLLDDLYQSGVSMNYVAMVLLEAGARKVLGLACEKTCTNDDNVSRAGRR